VDCPLLASRRDVEFKISDNVGRDGIVLTMHFLNILPTMSRQSLRPDVGVRDDQ
jgi:hypothetical protein